MSLKIQLRYQYRYFIHFLYSLAWPSWMENKTTKVGLSGLVVILVVGYVFQTSAMSTSGYVVHDLENTVAALQSENEKIETEVARFQSMASIQKRLTKEEFVAAHPSKFLKVSTDAAVALR